MQRVNLLGVCFRSILLKHGLLIQEISIFPGVKIFKAEVSFVIFV